MNEEPVPLDGLPPVAVQLKVTGGTPPEAVAEHETAVPTIPVRGQVIVTVNTPPTDWDAVAITPLWSVTVSVTVKGPAVE